jgi:hypothetical protein
MPYLNYKDRELLANIYDVVSANKEVTTAGHINYVITLLLKRYIEVNGESYQIYNDCVGSLENCKMELYRRKIAFYENTKIETSGDVY